MTAGVCLPACLSVFQKMVNKKQREKLLSTFQIANNSAKEVIWQPEFICLFCL